MDQTHDIAYYMHRGLKQYVGGGVHDIVEPSRSFAAIYGWGKDEPFTALLFIGFPSEVTLEGVQEALDAIDVQKNLDWSAD